jgi:hypothetical protein
VSRGKIKTLFEKLREGVMRGVVFALKKRRDEFLTTTILV